MDYEREYSPSSCIGGNYQPFVAAYRSESLAAIASTIATGAIWQTLPYGENNDEQIVLCRPSVPIEKKLSLLVFIHGGYWQELSAADSLWAAHDCVAQGHAFAAIDYSLAPRMRVDRIVDQCQRALAFLHRSAAALGINADNIVVAGSSAGAHLAAMVASPHAKAAVLVSGIYDLRPLIHTSINRALGLTVTSAIQNSPALQSKPNFPCASVVYGDNETAEFKRQSREFAAQVSASCQEISGRNHFDVIMDLARPGTVLGDLTLNYLNPANINPTNLNS